MPTVDMWRTNNMALAALLILEGHDVVHTEWDGNSHFWFFKDCNELANVVADFYGDMAECNPKEHSKVVGRLKSEMFSTT